MEQMGIGILLSYSVSGMASITSADRMLGQFVVNAGKANAQLTTLGRSLVRVGAGALTMAAGMAMVNASLDNVRAYADYEESLAFTQGLLGATREEMAAMEEQAFSLARTTRYTAGESMDAYYELLSAGLSQQEAMDALETTLKGAVIGNMEAAESADMITTAMRSFQIPATQSLEIMDKLTMGTRLSKIHFDEYTHAFGTFGGVMNAANQSMEDSIALFGVMRTAGLSASRASMMIRMMGTHLMGMSEANRARIEELNVHIFDSMGQMRALPDIMRDIFAALPEMSPELMGRTDITEEEVRQYAYGRLKTFTDVFGMRAVAGLLNVYNAQIELNGQLYEGVDAVDAMSAAIGDAYGYTDNYYDLMSNTINEKVRIMQSTIDLIKVQLGEALAKSAAPIMDKIIEGLNYVSQFLEAHPEVAKAIGVAVLLGGVILTVAGAVAVIAGLKTLFVGFGTIFAGMMATLGWILLAVVAIGAAAFFIIKYWDEVKAFFVDLGNWLWSKFGTMLKILAAIGVFLFEKLLMPFFNFFVTSILPALLLVGALISGIIGAILIVLDLVWGVSQTVHAFLEALFTGDWDRFNEEMDRIWSQISTEVEALGDLFITTIGGAIVKIADDLSGGLYSRMAASGEAGRERGVTPFLGEMGGYWDAMWGVDDASLASLAPSNASGNTRIPRDGMYYLHEDEQVSQRGDTSNSTPLSIGTINFYSYGKEDPETFGRRAYQEFLRCASEEREATVGV
jgi:hypothetical protein